MNVNTVWEESTSEPPELELGPETREEALRLGFMLGTRNQQGSFYWHFEGERVRFPLMTQAEYGTIIDQRNAEKEDRI